MQLAPWKTCLCLPPYQGPLTLVKLKASAWVGLGVMREQAGVRENLELVFLASAPAEEAVRAVLLMRVEFCMVSDLLSFV